MISPQLLAKLRFDPNKPIIFLNVPERFNHFPSQSLPDLAQRESVSQVLLFVQHSAELTGILPLVIPKLEKGAFLWIAYPKVSSDIPSDLSRDKIWELVMPMGRRPVGQTALDKDWSALWFKDPDAVKDRSREYPEIDLEKRIIRIPADLHAALDSAGVLPVFEKMSFTHRREHVEAILEAKKEETRNKRVEKTVDAMLARSAGSS